MFGVFFIYLFIQICYCCVSAGDELCCGMVEGEMLLMVGWKCGASGTRLWH